MTSPDQKGAEVEQEEQKLFPLEKITSMSARDYCDSQKKLLSDYEVVPVHARLVSSNPINRYPDIREELAKNVPGGAERVTDYTPSIAMDDFTTVQYAAGTALIPKKELVNQG